MLSTGTSRKSLRLSWGNTIKQCQGLVSKGWLSLGIVTPGDSRKAPQGIDGRYHSLVGIIGRYCISRGRCQCDCSDQRGRRGSGMVDDTQTNHRALCPDMQPMTLPKVSPPWHPQIEAGTLPSYECLQLYCTWLPQSSLRRCDYNQKAAMCERSQLRGQ